MGFKKQAIVALSIVSLLATNIGLANFASADQAEDGQWIPTPGVTCSEAQNAINSLDEHATNFNTIKHGIRITEDCAANLVIPAGKTVKLSLYSEDENGQITYHKLTNNGGNTITVEEGASFYYESSDTPEEIISNTTEGQAIIKNYGKVHILSGTFMAESGAYTFDNYGELSVVGNSFIGTKIQNASAGKIRIVGGTFDNLEAIRPYVVSNRKIDESNRVVSIFSEDKTLYEYLELPALDNEFPVGYSFTAKPEYADYLEAMEAFVASSDESVMKITGSNSEGWTVTVVGPGEAGLVTGMIYAVGTASIHSYLIPSNVIDTTESLTKYLVNKFFELIRQAVGSGSSVSLDTKVEMKVDVDSKEETAIKGVISNDTLVGYYNVDLTLNAGSEKTNVEDLGTEEIEVHLPATFIDDLTPVKSGYRRSFYVVRYHKGVAEKLPATLNNNEIVFKSGKFSTYAVAYTDAKITAGGSTSSSSNTNGNTSSTDDNSTSSNGNINANPSDSSSGVGTPDTGTVSSSDNGGAVATITSVAVVLAFVSGVFTYLRFSKKQECEK